MRSVPFYPLLVVILVGLGSYLGCDPSGIELPVELAPTGSGVTSQAPTVSREQIPARTGETILIGSFNLQRLGPGKVSNPWVMEKFAQIIRQYDVIALQEITSENQKTLPTLVNLVNSNGAKYSYTIGPRVGRSASGYYEQYAFVFDSQRVFSGPEFCYSVQDDQDVLHREPFVGRFRTLATGRSPFQFTLINMHTDPDEISQELNVLADVFRNVRQYEYANEDDVMLVGDLNAAPDKLLGLNQIPDLVPLVRGIPTNVRKSKTLDNILIDRIMTTEFTGRFGTIDLQSAFQLELVDAQKISDHLPIWAEFSIFERARENSAVAGREPNPALR